MTAKLIAIALCLVSHTATATDYTWPTTDYGGLSATDYSWSETERKGRFDALRPVEHPQPVAYYPTHPVRWNINGYWNYSREYIIEHLLSGQHQGKFSRDWLGSLGMVELQSLHDHDHEGTVQWRYVGKPVQVTRYVQPVQQVQQAAPVVRYQTSSCPNGNCPDQRFQRKGGGLFNIFKRKR